MRYIVYGAGAIGGVMASRLMATGREVVLIASATNRAALAARGLELQAPDGSHHSPMSVAAHPSRVGLRSGDVVILSMKSQDTLEAVRALAACVPEGRPETITVLCAQNGVENERVASRLFPAVLGAFVYVYATHPEAGVVRCFTAPSYGVIDIGAFPRGVDQTTLRIRKDLRDAGFDSEARLDIMASKYAKLLANLSNAPDAAYGPRAAGFAPLEEARREALACFAAAGIASAPAPDCAERIAHLLPLRTVGGHSFPGGSTWQSLERRALRIEIDYLTGEVVLLGRLHGVPTPVNSALLSLVKGMAARGDAPGSLDPAEFASTAKSQGEEQDDEEAV